MIIPALIRRYDRLNATEGAAIAPKGYSEQQISFKIVITKRGELHAIEPVFVETQEPARPRQANTKNKKSKPAEDVVSPAKIKRRPKRMFLPGQSKPSGSGLNPCTLWDNAAYMLGFKADDLKPERTSAAFQEFRKHHARLAEQITDEAVGAVAKFLENWKPSNAREHQDLAAIATNFGVFQIIGEPGFVHERANFKSWWLSHGGDNKEAHSSNDASAGYSLADGQLGPIARLHQPMIKSVAGAQSSGAAIVSFNQDAFTSFGKEQGDNSPLSVDDAEKYCTALNALTTNDQHRVRIAGDTYVFWAEADPEQDVMLSGSFCNLLDGSSRQAAVSDDELRAFTDQIREGRLPSAFGGGESRFHILGLAPNMSRLSIRLWLSSSVREFAERIGKHLAGLKMEPVPDSASPPSVRELVNETAPPKSGFADSDRVAPGLAGAVMHAVLTGRPYPRALLTGIVGRVRIEGLADSETRKDFRKAQHRRCAAIRACLTRNHSMEIPVALDTARRDPPYLLGRLFAVLERTQENAVEGNLNRTIRDAYYGSASTTPAAIFPRLLSLSRHHLNKIESTGQRITREKEVGSIVEHLNAFPTSQGMENQGLFAIGYYHQRQSYYTRKDEAADAD